METISLPQSSLPYKTFDCCKRRQFITFPLSQLPSSSFDFLSIMGDFQLVLIGEFLGLRRMPEAVMRQFVAENWRVQQIPDIIRREDERWVFTFSTREEAIEVMENGPFEIEGSLFGFARPTPHNPFPRVDFTRIPIWIELRRMPPELMTRHNVAFLASHIGPVIRMEMRQDRDWHTAYPRVYVYLNILNPVPPSVGVGDEDDPTEVIISYRGFQPCRRCGRLGHSMGRCRASEAMVIRDLNAMIVRLENRGGVGPITSANHALYTSANQGRGLLNNWIYYNPDPQLMTPNQGGSRAAREQPRNNPAAGPSQPQSNNMQPMSQAPAADPGPSSSQSRPMQNGRAHAWEIRDIYAPPNQASTGRYPQSSLSASQNPVPPSSQQSHRSRDHMQVDQVLHLQNPVADEEDRQRQMTAESDPTLIIYVNDEDVPEEERHLPRPATPVSNMTSRQPSSTQGVSQAQIPVIPMPGYVLCPWPMAMAVMPLQMLPLTGSVVYNGQTTMLQDIFQTLRLGEGTQNSRIGSHPLAEPQPFSISASPSIPQPLRLSPSSVLDPHPVPTIPASDYLDDDTLADQIVLMEQFRAHQVRQQSEEMRLARSVTSPSRDEFIPLAARAIPEVAIQSRPEDIIRRLRREGVESSANLQSAERHVQIRRRGRRPGKEPMEEAESSARRSHHSSLPPWPSMLGMRARESDSEDEGRHVRQRLETAPSSSSHNAPKEGQIAEMSLGHSLPAP